MLVLVLKAVLFMMTSGQMWNHIRAPPFVESDPRSGSVVSNIWSCCDFFVSGRHWKFRLY